MFADTQQILYENWRKGILTSSTLQKEETILHFEVLLECYAMANKTLLKVETTNKIIFHKKFIKKNEPCVKYGKIFTSSYNVINNSLICHQR